MCQWSKGSTANYYPSHATRKCPKCDNITDLDVSLLAHVLSDHWNATLN